MPEFLRLVPPQEALDLWLRALPDGPHPATERSSVEDALDRVITEDIRAPHPLPPFTRSTVDGYAVRAADTHGASASLPAYLNIVGEVPMGDRTGLHLDTGQAVLVHTGGMIPEGSDAVVMVEDTQAPRADEIEVLNPVAHGENLIQVGEDVQAGDVVLRAGRRIRAQEIGGLLALGIMHVSLAAKPNVAIISTGDEVVAPDQEPGPGQVRDVNTATLSALVRRAGGEPRSYGIIPDDFSELLQYVREAHSENDVVVITAGSSVSTRDMTADVIAETGEPGVLVHGVSVKPGKPTILAVAEGVPVVGLPGNPVSALVIAGLFLPPLLNKLLGVHEADVVPTVQARMTINVASETGREDYMPVRLHPSDDGWLAEPVFGRSNLIFTLVRANGLVRIPPQATGLASGEHVKVLPI